MRLWTDLAGVPTDLPATSVTIGTFDGVHAGHRALLDRVVADAARGLLPVAVTFDPHPLAVVRPDLAPALLTTVEHRVELLAGTGLAGVLVLPFTPQRASQEAGAFVREVLVGTLHARRVVVGGNFRFGHKAGGDVELLRRLGVEHGYTVDAVGLVASPPGGGSSGHALPVSSTVIRAMVAAGDVAGAARALGRAHRVQGPVVAGDRRGRDLGFPTANLDVDPALALPADGVYAGRVRFSDDAAQWWPAAVSVGSNPTFHGVTRRVEVYVIDAPVGFDVYGCRADLDLVARLRGMEKFDDVAALVAQMRQDVAQARVALDEVSATVGSYGRGAPPGPE